MSHLNTITCRNCKEVFCEFCEIECPKCHQVYYDNEKSINLRKKARQYHICNSPMDGINDIQTLLDTAETMRQKGRPFEALGLCGQARSALIRQANKYAIDEVGFKNEWDLEFKGTDEEISNQMMDAGNKKMKKFVEYINNNKLAPNISESLASVFNDLGDTFLVDMFKKETELLVEKKLLFKD